MSFSVYIKPNYMSNINEQFNLLKTCMNQIDHIPIYHILITFKHYTNIPQMTPKSINISWIKLSHSITYTIPLFNMAQFYITSYTPKTSMYHTYITQVKHQSKMYHLSQSISPIWTSHAIIKHIINSHCSITFSYKTTTSILTHKLGQPHSTFDIYT